VIIAVAISPTGGDEDSATGNQSGEDEQRGDEHAVTDFACMAHRDRPVSAHHTAAPMPMERGDVLMTTFRTER
jgi:hypothetical protein